VYRRVRRRDSRGRFYDLVRTVRYHSTDREELGCSRVGEGVGDGFHIGTVYPCRGILYQGELSVDHSATITATVNVLVSSIYGSGFRMKVSAYVGRKAEKMLLTTNAPASHPRLTAHVSDFELQLQLRNTAH
jgi:hypothetical protein